MFVVTNVTRSAAPSGRCAIQHTAGSTTLAPVSSAISGPTVRSCSSTSAFRAPGRAPVRPVDPWQAFRAAPLGYHQRQSRIAVQAGNVSACSSRFISSWRTTSPFRYDLQRPWVEQQRAKPLQSHGSLSSACSYRHPAGLLTLFSHHGKIKQHQQQRRQSSAITVVPRPTFYQKRVYAVQCAVPMVGFGVMDNLIMIQAGDLIDCTLGATFGLATITAAALGQICSDTSGICFGGFVDAAFNRLGLPVSDLTPDQLALDSVRIVRTMAMAVGVLSGCLLGMTSLLFMDLDKKERLKRQAKLATIFSTLAEEGSDLCNVERCSLYIVEEDQRFVWSAARKVRHTVHAKEIKKQCVADLTKAAIEDHVSVRVLADCLRKLNWSESDIAEALPPERQSLTIEECVTLMDDLSHHDEERIVLREGGTKHWVVHNKDVLNVKDIASDKRFTHSEVRKAAKAAGVDSKWTLLVGPVFEANDGDEDTPEQERKVIGLVEMVNRRDEQGKVIAFSEDDEKLVRMLCGHCSTFISHALDDD
ncbi:unnamed protein product [Amoebophrya sp. A120]|nr:unnamed protein product [Amoebophrya sp. A120]|eukprot:GSA120T00012686001.1